MRMIFSLSKYIILIIVPSFYDQFQVYRLLQGKAVFKHIIFDHDPTGGSSIRTNEDIFIGVNRTCPARVLKADHACSEQTVSMCRLFLACTIRMHFKRRGFTISTIFIQLKCQ